MSDLRHELIEAEEHLLNQLRQLRRRHRTDSGGVAPAADPNRLTMGQKIADSVASNMGSWRFILIQSALLLFWVVANVTAYINHWDPYPFILLNLFLSMLASVQAPVIMMSQNRQDKKDRLRSELDFDVNRRAHGEIQGLAHKINLLGDKLGDIEDLLRGMNDSAQTR